MRKYIRKILKIILRVVLGLIALIILSLIGLNIYLHTGPGKRMLASKASGYLNKLLGVEVSIASADWSFPATVNLHGIIIKDHRHNNMLTMQQLDAGLAFYNALNGRITLSEVTLDSVRFNLVRYPGDSSSNFGFVINRLSQPGADTSKHHHTDVMFETVNINNMHFTWDDQTLPHSKWPGIDWDHIDVKDFNGRFTYLWIDGNDVSAKIKKLNLKESSGFAITDMIGIAKYTSTGLEVKSMDLQTPYTRLGRHIKMTYDNESSLADFINKVNIEAELSNSKASFKDLAFFTHDLKNKTDSVIFNNLEARGTVADFKVDDIDASFGDKSVIKGKVEMKGLPSIDETFIAARLSQTRTTRADLERLFPELGLPEEIDRLGLMKMKGNFTGFINDFVAFADFETDIGNVSSDLNMKITKEAANCVYSGKVSLNGFNMGALTAQPLLGIVTMNGQVQGKGLTLESVNARLVASAQQFDFKKYSYHDIRINGEVASKFFKGSVKVNDKNLVMDFQGSVDYNHEKPGFDFTADIPKADLYALNLASDSLSLTTKVFIDLKGIHPDDIDGQIIARSTSLFMPDHTYAFDSININSRLAPHYRSINIYSDIVNGKIDGDFQLSRVGDLLKTVANKYVDTGFLKLKAETPADQYVNFDLHFFNMAPVFSVLRTDVSVADSGYVKGSIYANESRVQFNGAIPSVSYHNMQFNNLVFSGLGTGKDLNAGITLGTFTYNDSVMVRDGDIKLTSNTDKVHFDIKGADELRQKSAELSGNFDVNGPLAYIDLDSSTVGLMKEKWRLGAQRITVYGDTLVDIPLLALGYNGQNIRLAGQYGVDHSYPLRVILENLEMQTIADFVPDIKGFVGQINGQVLVNNLNAKPIVEAALYVGTLSYKNDTLGTLSAATSYNEETRKLSVDTRIESLSGQTMASAKGDIAIIGQRQALALQVALNQTSIKVFEPFLGGIFSEMKGEATADIDIGGYLTEPIVKGNIHIQDAEFKVDYTNVKYHFTHDFTFSGRVINIKNLEVFDAFNNSAKVNGKFDLSRLDNIRMSLEINAKKVMALNTTQKLNDLYFGKAFGTGLVTINGPFDNLKFVIKMKTEKGTTFSMPVSQGNTFYGHDYIKFVSKNSSGIRSQYVKLSGIELNMDIEITPDAFAQIIFDPRVGDIIEAHGKGNLRLDVNTDGDFNMFGTYTITDGNYRFTAFDIINKSFTINPGSTIAWSGNPYEAQLNVEALYTVRTTLSPLMSNSTTTQESKDIYSKVYPVDAKLKLTGSLQTPEIKLDFEIRELYSGATGTAELDNVVRQIRNNEQELDQQVVSLLVLNQFVPVDQSFGSGGIGVGSTLNSTLNSSVGDLISNTVNYWLSKYSEDIHVGIDYRSSEEATFRISQDLLKQRANITASYDFINNNYNTQLSYKIRPDGNLQAKIFGRSNNNPILFQNSNTQGVGLLYHREFDKIDELFRKRTVQKPQNP